MRRMTDWSSILEKNILKPGGVIEQIYLLLACV